MAPQRRTSLESFWRTLQYSKPDQTKLASTKKNII